MDAIDGVDSSKPFSSPIKFTMIGVCQTVCSFSHLLEDVRERFSNKIFQILILGK